VTALLLSTSTLSTERQVHLSKISKCQPKQKRGYCTGQTSDQPDPSHIISHGAIGDSDGRGCAHHLLLSCSTYTVHRCIHAIIVVWWRDRSGDRRRMEIVDVDIWLIIHNTLTRLTRKGVWIDVGIGIGIGIGGLTRSIRSVDVTRRSRIDIQWLGTRFSR
jgi:hypothetical protein